MPVNGRTATAVGIVTGIEGGVVRGDATGGQQGQLNIVARRQRNADDRVRIDKGADLGGIGLQLRSLRGDLHRVGNRADVHLELKPGSLIKHEGDRRQDFGIKTGRFGFQLIGANRKTVEVKNTTLGGFGGGGSTALGVASGDGSVIQGRSGRIFHGAGDRRGDLLTQHWLTNGTRR